MKWAVVSFGCAVLCGGCYAGEATEENEPFASPCVDEFELGERLELVLGEPYDPESDYWFDAQVVPYDDDARESCDGMDGLEAGVAVSFTLDEPPRGDACAAPLGSFEPETVTDARPVHTWLPQIEEVSIAQAHVAGTLDGRAVQASRGLFTPLGDAFGPLEPRGLPPLVVVRRMRWTDGDLFGGCRDAWVAAWR